MKNQTQTTIFVNPVPRISPQGRDKQTYSFIDPKTGELVVTQNMNKTRELGVGVVYSFKYNPVTNKLQTGLEEVIRNPFYELEVSDIMEQYGLSYNWTEPLKGIIKQSEIKKQTYFEILDNVNPEYYSSEIKGNVTIFNMTKSTRIPEDPNFLQRFSVVLYDGPNRFSDDTPRGRLAIQLIKNHNKIAHSKRDVNPAVHDFYISEENEAAIEKAKKQDIINEAIFNLVNLQKGGDDFLNYQVAILLTNKDGKPVLKGESSPANVKRVLTEYISESSSQLENVEKFMKTISLLDGKENRERFNVMYLVQQAINTNVMSVKDGYYIWHSKSGTPNMYKHINYDKFISLLQNEKKNWIVSDENVTNWYADLFNEVKSKNIRVE